MPLPLLSVDYELFGNGSGDLYHDLIYPTNRLLYFLDCFNEKAIFYVEGLEFSKLCFAGIDVTDIKAQIVNIVERGHSIGLHVHPQW